MARSGLLGMNVLSYLHDFFINTALVLTVPMVLSFARADAVGVILAAGGALHPRIRRLDDELPDAVVDTVKHLEVMAEPHGGR